MGNSIAVPGSGSGSRGSGSGSRGSGSRGSGSGSGGSGSGSGGSGGGSRDGVAMGGGRSSFSVLNGGEDNNIVDSAAAAPAVTGGELPVNGHSSLSFADGAQRQQQHCSSSGISYLIATNPSASQQPSDEPSGARRRRLTAAASLGNTNGDTANGNSSFGAFLEVLTLSTLAGFSTVRASGGRNSTATERPSAVPVVETESMASALNAIGGGVSHLGQIPRPPPAEERSSMQSEFADSLRNESEQAIVQIFELAASKLCPVKFSKLVDADTTTTAAHHSSGSSSSSDASHSHTSASSPSGGASSSSSRVAGGDSVQASRPALQHLWISPFSENLPTNALDSVGDIVKDVLVDRFLRNCFMRSVESMNDDSGHNESVVAVSPDSSICRTVSSNLNLREIKGGQCFTVESLKFRVISCMPAKGMVDSNTEVHIMGKPLQRRSLARLHLLPVSSPSESGEPIAPPNQIFERYVRPYFMKHVDRHVVLHESIHIRDLWLKVVAAEPIDGVVDADTRIHVDGSPLVVFNVVEIQPLTDTLPMQWRQLDCTAAAGGDGCSPASDHVLSKFVTPYFAGRDRIVIEGEIISLCGVGVRVLECSPPSGDNLGVVGPNTRIHVSQIFTSLAAIQQVEADGRMARELQIYDERASLLAATLVPLLVQHHMRDEGVASRNDIEEMAETLRALGLLEQSATSGASEDEIETYTLTWSFTEPLEAPKDESEREHDDRLTCRICLSEYSLGDLVRCLPCFHKFHATCSSNWLKQNKACPICKVCIDVREGEAFTDG